VTRHEMAIEAPRLGRAATRLMCPALLTRLLARARRFPLDVELAAGADPAACGQLAAHAAWLTRRATRGRLARSLEHLASAPEWPPSAIRTLPSRTAVRENRDALLELAGLLRSDRRLYVRGVARLDLLLIDGAGPVFADRRGEALARALELAREALAA
jgi:hypothetical protein